MKLHVRTTRRGKTKNNRTEEQRNHLESLKERLKVKEYEDWYHVTTTELKRQPGGRTLLNHYNGSLHTALQTIYPEYAWKAEKMVKRPHRYWHHKANQRSFLEEFAGKRCIEGKEGWYALSNKDVIEGGGRGILRHYGNSLSRMLRGVYEEEEWEERRFKTVPKNYWKREENQRRFMDEVARKLGIEDEKGWYAVKLREIEEMGGGSMLDRRRNNLFETLRGVYPERKWRMENSRAKRKLQCEERVKCALLKLQREFGIERKRDWYQLSKTQMAQLKGFGMISTCLEGSLRRVHSEQKWNHAAFEVKNKQATQRRLTVMIRRRMGSKHVIANYMFPDSFFETSCFQVEVDIFIPELNTAVEYQGEQHYEEIPSLTSTAIACRDLEKMRNCESKHILVIIVPFWCQPHFLTLNNQLRSSNDDYDYQHHHDDILMFHFWTNLRSFLRG